MGKKKCTKCGKVKDVSEFHKNNKTKDGLCYDCKECRHKYNIENRKRTAKRTKIYRKINKKIISSKGKQYYDLNKEEIIKKRKQYYQNNEKKCKERDKLYYEKNKKVINENFRRYKSKNKEKLLKYKKQYRESDAKYELHYGKLTIDELPRLHSDGISMEVLCKYCGKYFIPTYEAVKHRVGSLNGDGGDGYLYCSEDCKQACPVYGQIKYPKGFKQISKNSGHEGDDIWRQEVIKRNIEEYGQLQCEICGNTNEDELSVHHEKPQKTHPEMSLDPDNGWVLCAFGKGNNCHLKYGHPKGTNCSTGELAKLICVEKPRRITKYAD